MSLTQDLLTKDEVATMLKVHPRTIHRIFKSGKLKGIQLTSRVLRFRKDDVEKLLNSVLSLTRQESDQESSNWIKQQIN